MKTSFTLRDFSLSAADAFDQKQVLLVIRDSSELPVPFQNAILGANIDASKVPDSKYLIIEGQYEGIEKLGILRINSEKPLAHQVADIARTFEGSVGIYVGASLNCDEAVFGFALGSYRFAAYLTEKKESPVYELVQSSHLVSAELLTKIQSIYLARDLVNMPPNEKNPSKLTHIIQELPWKNTQVRVLDAAELKKNGFGMLLAVASGSDIPASVVVLERNIIPGISPDF